VPHAQIWIDAHVTYHVSVGGTAQLSTMVEACTGTSNTFRINVLPPRVSESQLTPTDSYEKYRNRRTPLIIDNGSTNLRWGFCSSHTPSSGLNIVAKYKERKYNKPLLLFGEAIDAESGAKGQAKTPWEGDVLLNFDALVCAPLRTANSVTLLLISRRMHSTMPLCS